MSLRVTTEEDAVSIWSIMTKDAFITCFVKWPKTQSYSRCNKVELLKTFEKLENNNLKNIQNHNIIKK